MLASVCADSPAGMLVRTSHSTSACSEHRSLNECVCSLCSSHPFLQCFYVAPSVGGAAGRTVAKRRGDERDPLESSRVFAAVGACVCDLVSVRLRIARM